MQTVKPKQQDNMLLGAEGSGDDYLPVFAPCVGLFVSRITQKKLHETCWKDETWPT